MFLVRVIFFLKNVKKFVQIYNQMNVNLFGKNSICINLCSSLYCISYTGFDLGTRAV